MSISVAVVGAGWYGCHIASSMKILGFDVTVFEQNRRPLHEASGNNQFRLHLGFHYARHHATRVQSRDGFGRFQERYPELSREVPENVYAVPRAESLIDFQTYRLIMTSSGIDYLEAARCSVPLQGIDGLLLTKERVLLLERARAYFKSRLGSDLVLDHRVEGIEEDATGVVVNGLRFDFLVDATWGHHFGIPSAVFYEPTMLLYYEAQQAFPALTFVDGPLCSIYPTEDPKIFTLSSVPFTPLGHVRTGAEARAALGRVDHETVVAKVAEMEAHVSKFVPGFRDNFRFVGPQMSIKTKPVGNYDDRSCQVFKRGRVFSVLSGKIDTIFFAMERILAIMEVSLGSDLSGVQSQLRQEIVHPRPVAADALSLAEPG
jgi:hypothetical protein